MRFRGSLAARVGILAALAVGLSVALVALVAYPVMRHQMTSSLDDSLLERTGAAATTPALERLTASDLPSWMFGAADVQIIVLRADGVPIPARSSPETVELGAPEEAVAQGRAAYSIRTVVTDAGKAFRVASVPGNQEGTALVLAQSLEPIRTALPKLAVVLALVVLGGVVAAGLAGWAVARNGLAPVRRLTAAVEDITRTQRLDPIRVEGNDEVARLAIAFNSMLASLAGSRDRQRQLVADAGHELRTPLTSLRTNLDLLTQAESRGGLPPAAKAELLDDVRFQIAELTTLIGDLTELARDQAAPALLEPVDLAEVAARALERVRRRAPGLDFDVELHPWPVTGEAASLERAVTNLVDNSVKWSPPQGTVTVRLTDGTLYVADQGRGIAPEDLPHVFERFYRSSEARTLPGSGLGLSIVRSVAERHGGTVQAGAAPGGGAAFWLTVPARPTAPETAPSATEAQSPVSA
jgi:two-component system sensor histidine kinase MprB